MRAQVGTRLGGVQVREREGSEVNVVRLAFHQTDHAQYINNISLHFLVIDSTGEDIEEMDEDEKVDTLPVTSSDNLVKKVRTYYVYKNSIFALLFCIHHKSNNVTEKVAHS